MTDYFIKNMFDKEIDIFSIKNDKRFVTVVKRVSYIEGKEIENDYQVWGCNFGSSEFEVEKVDESEIEKSVQKSLERLDTFIEKELEEILKSIKIKERKNLEQKYSYDVLLKRVFKNKIKLMTSAASPSSSLPESQS